MPEVGFEPGVRPAVLSCRRKEAGNRCIFHRLRYEFHAGLHQSSSVRLLNAAGYDVIVPEGQICCGALANHAGLRDTASDMARENICGIPDDESMRSSSMRPDAAQC